MNNNKNNHTWARDTRLEPQLLLLLCCCHCHCQCRCWLVLVVEVAVGLVLRWRGRVWQETPTSHDDSLVVVVGVVVGSVCSMKNVVSVNKRKNRLTWAR